MKIHYDSNTDRWIRVHNIHPITVSGPTKRRVIARSDEFANRYRNTVALRNSAAPFPQCLTVGPCPPDRDSTSE